MLTSKSHQFYSLVYKYQIALAKNEVTAESQKEIHPLRFLGNFFLQNLLLGGD